MRKEVQEALENAIAGFEKRQQAEQERLRERERFETDWAQIRTTVVLPALEEIAGVLRKAGWKPTHPFLVFAEGMQIATSGFHTYNHNLISEMRVLF